MLIEQTAVSGPVWTQLAHPIQVAPRNRPTGPLPVFMDDLAPGWQVEAHVEHLDEMAAEIKVIEDGRAAVAPRSGSPVFRGQAALAVQVDSLAPAAGSLVEVFRLSFRSSEPAEHYRTLRFAFHPGTAQVVIFPLLYLFVNDVHLSTLLLSSHPAWSSVSRTAVDMGIQEWHVVEVPLESLRLEEPIESISFGGMLSGTFYLDEIQLLPTLRPRSATAVLEERTTARPSTFTLAPNYPNPFNNSTVIGFDLPEAGETELAVYNLLGQKVATLLEGVREAGQYTLRWDGRDERETNLGSGVYFYRLRAGGRIATRKLLLLQ